MEDAMILNKSAVERGLGHATMLKTEQVDLSKESGAVQLSHAMSPRLLRHTLQNSTRATMKAHWRSTPADFVSVVFAVTHTTRVDTACL